MLKGKLAVRERGELREFPWEARRTKGDFSGTWEWPCATGSRPVQLRIERRAGQWRATYVDRGQKFPISDFYDFGGGFYFTHLIGLEGKHSLRYDEDSGWLIGEAVATDDGITGTIEFYPCRSASRQDGSLQEAHRVWRPRRVMP